MELKDGYLYIDPHVRSETINSLAKDLLPHAKGFVVVPAKDGDSWTGTRVGVVAVKAWAYATGKPIFELIDGELIPHTPQSIEPKYSSDFKVTVKNSPHI